jgi:hypothetical protein
MTTATVIMTKQADAQLDQLPEEEARERALKLCTKLSETPKFTKATRMSARAVR